MPGRKWTEEEIAYLKIAWKQNKPLSEIVDCLGRSISSVNSKASFMELHKKDKPRTVAHKPACKAKKKFKPMTGERILEKLMFLDFINSVPQKMITKGEFINADMLVIRDAWNQHLSELGF